MSGTVKDLIDKVSALLRKAVDEGSPDAERRTSALLAAELIAKHDMRVGFADGPTHGVDWVKLRPVRTFAQAPFRCFGCIALISMGEEIWWKPGAAWHMGCYREVEINEARRREQQRADVQRRGKEEER